MPQPLAANTSVTCAAFQTLNEKLAKEHHDMQAATVSLAEAHKAIAGYEAEIRDMEGAKERRLKVCKKHALA